MEKITRKEAFECALAQIIAVSQVVNNGKEKLYDYALVLRKNSVQPIVCLQPLDYFEWNNLTYGEKSYAFAPITSDYNSLIIGTCGRVYSEIGTYQKFKAHDYPAKWIKEVLTRQYMKLLYDNIGVFCRNELAYDTSLFSKIHSEWIKYENTEDDEILFFPYYTPKERQSLFQSLPKSAIEEITDEYWQD
jgi:hypothetical protein